MGSPSMVTMYALTRSLTMKFTLVLAALGGLLAASPVAAQDELFAGNINADSITVYSRTASGNTAPLRTLRGAATGLTFPGFVALDLTNNELVVANVNAYSITVYSLNANGNTAPLRTLSGDATGLAGPVGLALDLTNNELFVGNNDTNAVTVYSRTASGNTAPLRTLSGAATGLGLPRGIALDLTNNEVLVGNFGSNSVTVYSRTASGNTAPLRMLSGPATTLAGPETLALDFTNGELIVANYDANSVTVYSRTATGNTAPLRTLRGAATGLSSPAGLALDLTNNELVVANSGTDSVTVYSRTASGNAAPLRTLMGGTTGLRRPFGVAVTPAPPAASLVAAILPGSRSVQVGTPATAFATIINAGTATASQAGISPQTVIPASFVYQTTDPLTNAVTGTLNAPADILPGQAQTYVIALTPTAPFGPTDVAFAFAGANTAPVATLVGINTLLLSASATPVPDIVALAATLNNDGIVNIPGTHGTGIFAVATVNVGAAPVSRQPRTRAPGARR